MMVVQAPPASRLDPPEIDAGVIEDARRRQRRHRAAGLALTLLAACSLLGGLAAGGGGSGHGGTGGARPASSGPGSGAVLASARTAFPGAPVSQAHGYGVETNFCPLAPANRYLPARSGCVSVRRADVSGDGRPDLIIVYSTLSRERPTSYMGEPIPDGLRGDFAARAAFLKVVVAGGPTATARIEKQRITHAAAITAISHVGADPGDEIFLEVARISSGGSVAAYGFHAGQLVPAGAVLGYGGDSGAAESFDCTPGHPPRVVARSFVLLGPTIYGWWREAKVTYAWHGPRLVRIGERTFRRHGGLTRADYSVGRGCLHGIG